MNEGKTADVSLAEDVMRRRLAGQSVANVARELQLTKNAVKKLFREYVEKSRSERLRQRL